jgi:hypothetical protein
MRAHQATVRTAPYVAPSKVVSADASQAERAALAAIDYALELLVDVLALKSVGLGNGTWEGILPGHLRWFGGKTAVHKAVGR